VNKSGQRSWSARVFPADPESLAEIRAFLRPQAAGAGLSSRNAEDLILAVSEAGANAVLHSGSPDIEVVWTSEEDHVEVEVRDQGTFRRRVRLYSLDGPGGFGIPLMAALTEELVIDEGTPKRPGTRVRLVKRLDLP
jgi:anti-sigma regulatory factor (Ser/Thr protein kinase)